MSVPMPAPVAAKLMWFGVGMTCMLATHATYACALVVLCSYLHVQIMYMYLALFVVFVYHTYIPLLLLLLQSAYMAQHHEITLGSFLLLCGMIFWACEGRV